LIKKKRRKTLEIMNTLETQIAEKLLSIKAVKLQPNQPFTWASGWLSPIYCDNRKTLSHPELRKTIKKELAQLVKEKYPNVEVIAGVATGAIAQGAMVADELNLPFVYVRSSPKDHGLENLVEGDLQEGQKVVVIEDLISTGKSSLKAVDALRNCGADVLGMVANFSYLFAKASESFAEKNVELTTLSNYDAVLQAALKINYISEENLQTLAAWRKDPANWNPAGK
jgi:orotate phosphoribosyltransferase